MNMDRRESVDTNRLADACFEALRPSEMALEAREHYREEMRLRRLLQDTPPPATQRSWHTPDADPLADLMEVFPARVVLWMLDTEPPDRRRNNLPE